MGVVVIVEIGVVRAAQVGSVVRAIRIGSMGMMAVGAAVVETELKAEVPAETGQMEEVDYFLEEKAAKAGMAASRKGPPSGRATARVAQMGKP